MLRKPYSLPSVNSLVAFEAASRHLSLTRAAMELNVTPGAISKQIKILETDLGKLLFVRLHRALALTPEGESYASALREAFENISSVHKQLKANGQSGAVSLGTTTAFAQLWLMPRLAGFSSSYPDVTVDHVISDRWQELFRADVDLRIRYGDGIWPGEETAKMFGDLIFPIATPHFAKSHNIKSVKDLVDLPLLAVEGPDATWTSWEEFLRALGVPVKRLRLRRFNSNVVALQAAQSGQGVVLGWNRLVAPFMSSGALVRVSDAEMVSPWSYYVTWSNKKRLSSESQILRDWLLSQID